MRSFPNLNEVQTGLLVPVRRRSEDTAVSLNSHTYERGFTFLEVMIAVAIMAIALVSLLRLVVIGIDNADYDQTITLATFFAQEKLTEGLIVPEYHINSEGQGEEEFSIFTWKRTITPTIFKRIAQIKVEVTWQEGEDERYVSLTQFIFEG